MVAWGYQRSKEYLAVISNPFTPLGPTCDPIQLNMFPIQNQLKLVQFNIFDL